jgi:diguanylate cyclase (GGDEF)-like protein
MITKLWFSAGAVGAYIIAFFLLFTFMGAEVIAVTPLPAVVIGWMWGLRAGALAGLLGIPFDVSILLMGGDPAWKILVDPQIYSGAVASIIIGAMAGRMRDYKHHIRRETDNRQRTESALITKIRAAEEAASQMAYYDTLTGLPNRALFYDRLNQALALARRRKTMLAVTFLDVDRFKTINDTLGHTMGDRLLKSIADRLKNCVREIDTVSRFGGDEFTMIFPDVRRVQDIDIVAHKILHSLSEAFLIEGHELFVTASMGISLFPADGCDADILVKGADTAMYRAKEKGKNNYQFYRPEMNAEALRRLTLENCMHKALRRNEFVLHYQPQVDLKSGLVTGAEVLIRWENPDLGFLYPKEFIPLAEETGLIVPIGEWLLYAACLQTKAWHRAGSRNLNIAVNLSMCQFRQKNLSGAITRALENTGLDPQYLDLELTEGIIMRDVEETVSTMRELRSLGIYLTIDDFGTGYSSLNYLKYLPLSKLKIDQSFVHGITLDPNDEAISKAIIVLAESLDLKVIAEGVETIEQLEFLRAHNCDEAQGYLLGKPLPAEEFTRLLEDDYHPVMRKLANK